LLEDTIERTDWHPIRLYRLNALLRICREADYKAGWGDLRSWINEDFPPPATSLAIP
jgi:hypothetical protein